MVRLSAELSMFLLCGDDGGGVSPSRDVVILSCAAAVLKFSPVYSPSSGHWVMFSADYKEL